MTYSDSRTGALELIDDQVDARFARAIEAALKAGSVDLVPDPSVFGVWGLVDVAGACHGVLYVDSGDVELDDEWWLERA